MRDDIPRVHAANKDGTTIDYDVVMTFTNDNNGKDYVIYTDNTTDDEGRLNLMVGIYDPCACKIIGNPETDDEWDMIYSLLDDLLTGKQ